MMDWPKHPLPQPAWEVLADNLSFPTSVTFDPVGTAYVAESGLAFADAPAGGRVWRLNRTGTLRLLADALPAPVNGLVFHNNALYVSGGAQSGCIIRIDLGGMTRVILEDLPGRGNYHTNMVAFGPEGRMYFSQGAMTNSGIIGLDSLDIAWLRELPHACDIPGLDITLTGFNASTVDPFDQKPEARALTGAFAPFGAPTKRGESLSARLPCTAAIMSVTEDGRDLKLVAWGLRNAFALGFLPDGRLIAIDQGFDDRGSRPIGEAPDALFEIRAGAWYGWPDFVAGEPVTDPSYRPTRGPAPDFLLACHDRLPPPQRPLVRFPPHVAAVKFAVVPETWSQWAGQLVVALFGDERPMTAPPGRPAGRTLVRIDPTDWSIHNFLTGPFLRPIDVAFDPVSGALVVVDFGHFEMSNEGVVATSRSGKVWQLAPR